MRSYLNARRQQGSSVSQSEGVISFCCGQISYPWPVSHTSLMTGVAGAVPVTPPDAPEVRPCSGVSREPCCVVGVWGVSAAWKLGPRSVGEDSPAFQSACSRAWPQDLGTRNDSVTAACGPGPGGRTDRGARVAAPRSVGVSFLETLSTFLQPLPQSVCQARGPRGRRAPSWVSGPLPPAGSRAR